MSRHRIVRAINSNYEDEYYDEDDEYSRSVEDNYCISPGTAAQFTWNRDKEKSLDFATYMGAAPVIDEEEEEDDEVNSTHGSLSESNSAARLALSETDQALLNSCLEEIRNIIGDTVSEAVMTDVILKNQFNVETSLNQLLTQQEAPKQQRESKQRRNQDELDKYVLKDSYLDQQDFGAYQYTGLRLVFDEKYNDENLSPKENDVSDLSYGVENISVKEDKKSAMAIFTGNQNKPKSVNSESVLSKEERQVQTKKIGLSLAELAKVNNTKQVSISKVKVGLGEAIINSQGYSPSLADLAKQHKVGLQTKGIPEKNVGSQVQSLEKVMDKPSSEKNVTVVKPLQKEMDKLSSLVAQHAAKSAVKEKSVNPSCGKNENTDPNKNSALTMLAGLKSNCPFNVSSPKPSVPGPSLSDLAKKHASGSPKLEGGLAHTRNTHSTTHSTTKGNTLQSSTSALQKSTTGAKPSGLSLSDLAKQHSSKGSSISGGAPALSLSQLAQLHQTSKPFTQASSSSPPNVSLTGIIKQHSERADSTSPVYGLMNLNKDASQKNISDTGIVQRLTKIKLGDEHSEKENMNKNTGVAANTLSLSSCLKNVQVPEKRHKFSQLLPSPVENQFESDVSFSPGLSPSVSISSEKLWKPDSSLISEASNVGLVLCCLKRKRLYFDPSKHNKTKFPKLLVLKEIEKCLSGQDKALHDITKFDFSTPSPDDIVKKKQTQAFTRSEKEFTI